jgi:hypothetical protein
MATAKASPKDDGTWTWMQGANDKDKWSTVRIPAGDSRAPMIKLMSKNTDGTYSFYVFRNGKCIGAPRDKIKEKAFEAAKKLARHGKPDAKMIEDNKQMLAYIDSKSRDANEFKQLSEMSQVTIANVYPYAMPGRHEQIAKGIKVKAIINGGEALPTTTTPKPLKAPKVPKEPKAPRPAGAGAVPRGAKLDMSQVLRRLKKGDNPKKPGTGQHARWEKLFEFEGKSLTEYFKGGGDIHGIKQAVDMGWFALEAPK